MSDYEARRQAAIEAWRQNNPAACENCYGTGNADSYFADFQGRMVKHSVTPGGEPCYVCNRTGRSPKTLDGLPRFYDFEGQVFNKIQNAYTSTVDAFEAPHNPDNLGTYLTEVLAPLVGKRVSIAIQVLDD